MSTRRQSAGPKPSPATAATTGAAVPAAVQDSGDQPDRPDHDDGGFTTTRARAYPQEARLPSNADLQELLGKAMTRLENWRLELEMNPNPRMVHVLRNILGHMESIARVADTKTVFSYKHLSRQMSLLIGAVAHLNLAITESLDADDAIDAREEQRINASLKRVVEAAVELIRIVQNGFVLSRRLVGSTSSASSRPPTRPPGATSSAATAAEATAAEARAAGKRR